MDKADNAMLRENILKLKKQKEAVILAHNYQVPQIQEIADYLGDSLELARISKEVESKVIVFCGVKFMAETAKILSPQKKVLLPVLEAGCPLADMITPQQLLELKKEHPGAWVVSYVNSSAQIKALSDVCCTSSNAVKVVKNIPIDKVIFVPDKNLGWWVQTRVPDKEVIIWQGYCEAHQQFTLEDLEETKKMYPDARVLVHPECRKEILLKADFVLSTSGMLIRAAQSQAKRFIIGTEEGIIYRLKKENPNKEFYSLGKEKVCETMKKTTLVELYESLDKEIYQIELDKEVIEKAKKAIERMINYV
ncbi:MAG: quinolinate synthase NadA [Candidatus Omnitrophota bacterium]|nr:MAG: quinolinate synthase NadA [Candidatus Omnitrophota bacterium]